MKRWVSVAALSLAACGQSQPSPEQCKTLALPKAVVERCFGGDLNNGKYVGDLTCWPFSRPQRVRGLWVIALEASEFVPNVLTVDDLFKDGLSGPPRPRMWLQSDLMNQSPALRASGQGANTRIYAVDLRGRLSLCDGMFGHFGLYRREVVVERFYSMRLLRVFPDAPQ